MDSSSAEVSTIFHPRRSRAPSIILNDEQSGHAPYASPGHVVVDTGNFYLILIDVGKKNSNQKN